MAGTGTGKKRMMSYSQIRMQMNAAFVSLEIYSFYALVEEAFVLVEFFCEEMAAFLDLAAFLVSTILIWIDGAV